MEEIQETNIRTIIMDQVKQKFAGFIIWDRIEAGVSVICSDIPEVTNEERRSRLIEVLNNLKKYLIEEGVENEDLKFLDEEIEVHEHTKQISLYVDEEDYIPKDIILKYSHVGKGQEGLVAIHQKYNYTQLGKLTNGVYKHSKLMKFYISKEKILRGKIVAEVYEHPQKIPVATLVVNKNAQEDEGKPLIKKIFLFGQTFSQKKFEIIKKIEMPFYVYRFITDNNQELILLYTEKVEMGDYLVSGVTTEIMDNKALTDSTTLPTKLPFIFAQNCKNRIIKFKDPGEFLKRLNFLDVSKKNIFNLPFTVCKNNTQYILNHPEWFKKLIWAWLLHSPVGLFNNYPLHLLIIGPKQSGKSLLLNALHSRSNETRSIFSGSSSTMKNLVPSFKYKPAKLGYLAESNRFSFCDEFLRCLVGLKDHVKHSEEEEGVAIMNDLLEHQKREAGSGVSRVNVNMTSRILATTNPIRGMKCVEDVVNKLDKSFMSRILVYYQKEDGDHVKMVRQSNDNDLKILDYEIDNNEFLSLIDYLQSFNAEYDAEKVEEIRLGAETLLSENLKKHYDARHKHHISCLMDGIIKTRCFLTHVGNFKATQKDYDDLEIIWKSIIKTWIDSKVILNLPVEERLLYLPEDCQFLFNKIKSKGRPISRKECKEFLRKDMTKSKYIESMAILFHHNVLLEEQGYVRPHYMKGMF